MRSDGLDVIIVEGFWSFGVTFVVPPWIWGAAMQSLLSPHNTPAAGLRITEFKIEARWDVSLYTQITNCNDQQQYLSLLVEFRDVFDGWRNRFVMGRWRHFLTCPAGAVPFLILATTTRKQQYAGLAHATHRPRRSFPCRHPTHIMSFPFVQPPID